MFKKFIYFKLVSDPIHHTDGSTTFVLGAYIKKDDPSSIASWTFNSEGLLSVEDCLNMVKAREEFNGCSTVTEGE